MSHVRRMVLALPAAAAVLVAPGVPRAETPGAVFAFAGTTCPSGSLRADGSRVSRSTYVNLYAAIGTRHGAGDGATTFNLPDMRGQFVRGAWPDPRVIWQQWGAVDTTNDVLTAGGAQLIDGTWVSGHGLTPADTGTPVLVRVNVPPPLKSGATYYFIYLSADTYALASTREGALAGTRIDMLPSGVPVGDLFDLETPGYIGVQSSPVYRRRAPISTGASNGVGSVQDDAFQGHHHMVLNGNYGQCCLAFYAGDGNRYQTGRVLAGDPASDGKSGEVRTTVETRPTNTALLYCVAY